MVKYIQTSYGLQRAKMKKYELFIQLAKPDNNTITFKEIEY